jgi:hypothetical protein
LSAYRRIEGRGLGQDGEYREGKMSVLLMAYGPQVNEHVCRILFVYQWNGKHEPFGDLRIALPRLLG